LQVDGKRSPCDETTIEVMEDVVMVEDKDVEGRSTCCRKTSHLKSGFIHMEVGSKAELSPIPP